MKSANASFITLMLAALLITSCKKELNTSIATSEILARSTEANVDNKCRLVFLNWPNSSTWQFHYNEKGLADEWNIDYGFGAPLHTNRMTYDAQNRLIQSKEVFFDINYVIDFGYENNRLIQIKRSNVDFPGDPEDFIFTYNSKGQQVRQDDDAHDVHVLMNYDAMGNCLGTDLYFGNTLSFSDNYTFGEQVRNPLLNVPGVEIGFPFYGGTFVTNKRWFTSNRTVVNDNGSPFVVNDYDPSKTIIHTGNHNFPVTADYFDQVFNGPINITFEYENCNGGNQEVASIPALSGANHGQVQAGFQRGPVINYTSKSVREQIQLRLMSSKMRMSY